MIGRVVGNYRIVDRLGDGGMGSVYRAVDRMLDREVAIKVLRPDLARKEALVERFRQEAKALARLSHPRIATLHGLEQHGDELLMIMEFVRGDTLETIVERSGRITWPRACELCIAMLDALDHAHDMGVVHRDIKPANVMLAHNGAVKVMDFGIARMLGRSRQTQVGHAVGTPMYMAPEQLRGQEVDGRTDLYAVGAVLFELITGRMAFDADSDYALMMKKLNDPPPPPSEFVPEVPSIVDHIVFRAMANEPTHRFPNAMAFSQELARALELAPAAARTRNEKRSTPAPETRLAVDAGPDDHPDADVADADAPVTREPQRELRRELRRDARPDAGPDAHSAGSIAETRLADARPVAQTRLAEASIASTGEYPKPTRIGSSMESTATGNGTGITAHRWTDWRVYAAAGVIFAAAGLGVRAWRTPPAPPPEQPAADTVAVTPDPAGGGSVSNAPGEDASSLRVPPAAGPVPSEPVVPPSSPPAGSGSRERTPNPPAQRARGGGSSDGSSGSNEPPRSGGDDVRSVVPPVTPSPSPAPATVETASAARDAIRSVLSNALGELAQVSGAESLLQGNLRSDWVALAREGRISVGAPQGLDVDLQGSHANASFSSDVNVRSPFGANRKRSGQFTAELQRDGSRWRVLSVRPSGALSLK